MVQVEYSIHGGVGFVLLCEKVHRPTAKVIMARNGIHKGQDREAFPSVRIFGCPFLHTSYRKEEDKDYVRFITERTICSTLKELVCGAIFVAIHQVLFLKVGGGPS